MNERQVTRRTAEMVVKRVVFSTAGFFAWTVLVGKVWFLELLGFLIGHEV